MLIQKKDSRIVSHSAVNIFVATAIQLFSLYSFASGIESKPVVFTDFAKDSEDYFYDEYVVVQNQIQLSEQMTPTTHSAGVQLLNLKRIQKKFPQPIEKYDRKKHFGGWIRFAEDESCFDTRGIVLQRDSLAPVDATNCRVMSGDWLDPYTGQNYKSSADIQIDHVVPLKNAYMTGGFAWSAKKRCQYANYLGNKVHLMSVNGSENMKKGDRSPREYMPPNQKFTCEYLKNWLSIKYIWELRLTPSEANKIETIVKQEHCDLNDFLISESDIAAQKKYMKDNANVCVGAALTTF